MRLSTSGRVIEHPITNTEFPTSSGLQFIIGHSLFDIRYSVQLLLNRLPLHDQLRTPNNQHGISNLQRPTVHHWTFPVRYSRFSSFVSS